MGTSCKLVVEEFTYLIGQTQLCRINSKTFVHVLARCHSTPTDEMRSYPKMISLITSQRAWTDASIQTTTTSIVSNLSPVETVRVTVKYFYGVIRQCCMPLCCVCLCAVGGTRTSCKVATQLSQLISGYSTQKKVIIDST